MRLCRFGDLSVGQFGAIGDYFAVGAGYWGWYGEWGGCLGCEEGVGRGGSGGLDYSDIGTWTDTAYCNLGPGGGVCFISLRKWVVERLVDVGL